MINEKRMLDEFIALVKVNSSSRAEREVADLLKTRLTKLNLEVQEDNVGEKIGGNCGNVFGYLKGSIPTAPVLMLTAHMDCVEPCANVNPQIQDGIIKSDGSTILGGDDKAGVAAIMEALQVINEQKIPHGDIQIIFTVCEEGGLQGSKNIDKAMIKADFGYVLDSSGDPGKIIVKAPGQNKIHVKIHGKTAHAGLAPEDGINAIIVAGKALSQIKDGRIDEETTANIGIIQGGRATNIVPDFVEVTCEARSRNLVKLEEQTKHMCETFEKVAAENGANIEIDVNKAYHPYVLAEDMPVVQLAAKAAENIGLKAKCESTGGGSDANYFNSYQIPCSVLGIGMQKAHTTGEFILEQDLYNTAKLVLEIIKKAAALKK